jgi:hypothetical protein
VNANLLRPGMAYLFDDSALPLTDWTRILRIPRRPRESVDLPSPYAPSDVIEAINPRERAAAVLREIERQYEPKRQSGWEDYLDVGILNPPAAFICAQLHPVHCSLSVCLLVPSEPCFFEQYRMRKSHVDRSLPSPLLYSDIVRSVFRRAVVVGVWLICGLLGVEILLNHHNQSLHHPRTSTRRT